MTLLAYDPTRLRALAGWMELALGDLRAVRCDDEAAQAAMGLVRFGIDALEERWVPLVRRLARADPMCRPATLDLLPNALAWEMVHGYGWAAGADPLATSGMDAATARALGVRLGWPGGDAIARDPELLARATTDLRAVAADPDLARQLLANLPRLDDLLGSLAHVRAHVAVGDGVDRPALEQLDDCLAALAAVVTAGGIDSAILLDRLSPSTAATVLRDLDVDDTELAALTSRLLDRLAAHEHDRDDLPVGDTALDLVLPTLAARPDAAHALVLAREGHLGELFAHARRPERVYAMLAAATDPAHIDVAEAGRVVPEVIRAVTDTRPQAMDPERLADLVVPWSVQFTPGRHDWAIGDAERLELLHAALQSDRALARFVDRTSAVVAHAATQLRAAPTLEVEAAMHYLGMIGGLVMNGRLENDARRRMRWALVCGVAGLAASVVPGVFKGVTTTAGVMLGQVHVTGVQAGLSEHEQRWQRDSEMAALAAAAAAAVDQQMRQEGLLPASFAHPPVAQEHPEGTTPSLQFSADFDEWLKMLPGGPDGPLGTRATSRVYDVVAAYVFSDGGTLYLLGK